LGCNWVYFSRVASWVATEFSSHVVSRVATNFSPSCKLGCNWAFFLSCKSGCNRIFSLVASRVATVFLFSYYKLDCTWDIFFDL
jgi:hypothetical protein